MCIRKVERKGKEIEKKKLLNGHFWQLNGTDRSECRKMFFSLVDRKSEICMTSDFISSYLTRAHHFMRLKSRVLFHNNMALAILRDLCLDEESSYFILHVAVPNRKSNIILSCISSTSPSTFDALSFH